MVIILHGGQYFIVVIVLDGGQYFIQWSSFYTKVNISYSGHHFTRWSIFHTVVIILHGRDSFRSDWDGDNGKKEEKKEEEKATTRAVSDRISEEPVQLKKRKKKEVCIEALRLWAMWTAGVAVGIFGDQTNATRTCNGCHRTGARLLARSPSRHTTNSHTRGGHIRK